MSDNSATHAKGLLLTTIGGMALTIDIPLIRLADGDHWPILMVRSALTALTGVLVWVMWRAISGKAPPLVPGRSGLLVAGLYGISAITFISAVYNTSTANLFFILAFNSMFAALLSWLFLKERPQPATMIAMMAMLFGILVIVGDSIGTGSLFGDLMALTSAFSIALALTITRKSGLDMGFAALVGVVLPFLLAAVMTAKTGYRIDAPWWIVLNGVGVIPLAFFCLANGPKYLPGPEVAMFYLLETMLAPIWVWMIFSEVPSTVSMIGGVVIILTLVAHSLWQLHDGYKRRRAQGAIRHPV